MKFLMEPPERPPSDRRLGGFLLPSERMNEMRSNSRDTAPRLEGCLTQVPKPLNPTMQYARDRLLEELARLDTLHALRMEPLLSELARIEGTREFVWVYHPPGSAVCKEPVA